MLIYEVNGTFGVLVLFTQDLQSSFFSFKGESFDLEGLSLRERKFDLRESLDGRLDSLGRKPWRRVDKSLKMRGVGVYL